MTDPAAIDLTRRDAFRFESEEIIRFQDLDRLGHVNNVAFCVYAESGRVAFAETVWPGSTAGTGIGWTIVKIAIEFRAQAHFPGRVRIGTALIRLGRSSLTLGQGLFMADDGSCFGTVESVLVWTDVKSGKALPIPEEMRAAVAPYLV